jgi:formylmethanofuran dehydrogenase subunit B
VGSPAAELPPWLAEVDTIVIGPRASETALPTKVAVDTGVAGIHEAGIAYRADEVPLRLRPPLEGQPSAAEVLGALLDRVTSGREADRP